MDHLRDKLRLAAQEFADRLLDILREDLLPELLREAARSAGLTLPTPSPPNEPARADSLSRVVDFVREHPGASPKAMLEALGMRNSNLHRLIARACTSGALRKSGAGPKVRYFVTSAAPAKPPHPAPRPPSPPRPVERPELDVQVTAFVREHPGCRNADLVKATGATEGNLRMALRIARERGDIRLVGERIKARYYPPETTATSPKRTSAAPPPRATTVRPTPATTPPPARSRTIPPPPAVPREAAQTVRPQRALTGDRAVASAILAELDEALASGMHDLRLHIVLQAVAAEIRIVQGRLPTQDPLASQLDRAIRRITAVRAERELDFIVGLKRDAEANWAHVAETARRRLARFDGDAEQTVTRRRSRRPPSPAPTRSRTKPPPAPHPFPLVLALARSGPIVLVGGIKKNEVLDQIRERYSLEAEWVAAQGANARAVEAFVDRIRNGRIGAVVVLEGLFGHSQAGPIVSTAKAAGVPFAYGGRAGTDSLRQAFEDLERGLGPKGRLGDVAPN